MPLGTVVLLYGVCLGVLAVVAKQSEPRYTEEELECKRLRKELLIDDGLLRHDKRE